MRDVHKEALHAANKRECELLTERWTSEDCIQAIMSFFAKKAKM